MTGSQAPFAGEDAGLQRIHEVAYGKPFSNC